MSTHYSRSSVHPIFELNRIQSWLERDINWSDGLSLQSIGLNRLWVGRHARLSFELVLQLLCDGQPQTLMLQGGDRAKDWLRDGTTSRAHTHGRLSTNGLAGLRIVSDELSIWCSTPDRDRKLRVVRELLDDRNASSLLAETAAAPVLGLGRKHARVRCRVTSYRAGKRCAMLARSAGSCVSGRVFVKVFRRAPSAEQLKSNMLLASYLTERSGGLFRMPAYIDSCINKRLLISEALPEKSRPLEHIPEDIASAGALLAALHDAPIELTCKIHSPIDEFQTVCKWVRTLQVLRKPSYLRLRKLVVELSDRIATCHTPAPVLLHRDYFASQLMRSGATVWLLDLDTLSQGHPEVDVATFVAHIFLDGLLAGSTTLEVVDSGAGFVDCYRRAGGRVSNGRLQFYLPCALARLGAIHLARGVSAPVVEELWELARGHLDGSWALD